MASAMGSSKSYFSMLALSRKISAGVPSITTLPSLITITRSACVASSIKCVIRTMVMPCRLSSCATFNTSALPLGSS
ncbi:MAG TPA: hypothetical protein DCG79_05065, partial [Clostridiales bacterium]|nr:hypothetical protein [Clostridiales bacterium]